MRLNLIKNQKTRGPRGKPLGWCELRAWDSFTGLEAQAPSQPSIYATQFFLMLGTSVRSVLRPQFPRTKVRTTIGCSECSLRPFNFFFF